MFFYDNKEHKLPHIHAQYHEFEATISIDTGEILDGKLPQKQIRLVQAWIEIRKEDLLANWTLAVNGETPMKIDPLK